MINNKTRVVKDVYGPIFNTTINKEKAILYLNFNKFNKLINLLTER